MIHIKRNVSLRKVAHAINRLFFQVALKIENFQLENFDSFLIIAQNIYCGYTLEPPVTSTHNLCFGSIIGKIGMPLHTPVLRAPG